VAYVVPAGSDAVALKSHLVQRLPDYMVPTRWVGLDALPLTAGSKLDRNALPRPADEPRPVGSPAGRSKTPLEATIAAVWAEVLGRNGFSVDDPLFSVGADSLHVFRIAARLQRQGIAIDARDLMKNPTVAALARKAQDKSRGPRTESGRPAPVLADFRRGARRRSVSS
jgi:aryl carrier-like protein